MSDAASSSTSGESARARILARVRGALAGRAQTARPGDFGAWRPEGALDPDPVRAFEAVFTAAGGEVVALGSEGEARAWLADVALGFAAAAVGASVPAALRPALPTASAEDAGLGVGVARCAIAETGSLVLDARDGRRTQLLPPTHVVWVRAADVHATLREALLALRGDLPSALGLHSGPSKSADIGQILVRGVHGPGRLIAAILSG
jgi:L-lactate dehydrogenase complex protein LldG